MSLQNVLLAVLGVGVFLAGFKLFKAPLRLAFKVFLQTVLGFVFLILVNLSGAFTGIVLGVNLVNSLVLGLLGVPGFGLLLMMNWVLII